MLREDPWKSVNELAEELYAIFNSDLPVTIDGPLTVDNNTDQPGVVVNQFGGSEQALAVNVGDINSEVGGVDNDGEPTEAESGTGLPAPTEEGGGTVFEATITAINNDNLSCTIDGGAVTVLKPPTLRSTATPPVGVTYVMVDAQTRTATDGTFTETHVIIPPYAVGGTIYVALVGSTYVDLNIDSRAWAKQFPEV